MDPGLEWTQARTLNTESKRTNINLTDLLTVQNSIRPYYQKKKKEPDLTNVGVDFKIDSPSIVPP